MCDCMEAWCPSCMQPSVDPFTAGKAELTRSYVKHGPQNFHSAHEGYAVLNEEVEELWDEVKADGRKNLAEMEKEAIQVLAMAAKFIISLRAGWK